MKVMRSVWFGLIATMTICIVGVIAAPITADTGVGVDLAEISIDEVLTAGTVYNLPAVGVMNTGDRTADYEVEITYMSEQKEMMPSADWFQFEPQRFGLEAGTSKKIGVSLRIPQDAAAGQYFALIEAHPVVEGGGATTIGVAAATKLRFSVSRDVPVLTDIANFFRDHSPYSYIGLGLVVAVIAGLLLRRSFKFRLDVERR